MPDAISWDTFRAMLRRRGLSAAYALRCEQELAEHLEDLQAEARANGMSEIEAQVHATQALGELEQLADTLAKTARQSTWWGRHRFLGFFIFPVVCYSLALIGILVLGAVIGDMAGWWGTQDHLSKSGKMALIAALKTFYYGLLLIIPWRFSRLANRCHFGSKTVFWTVAGLMLHGIFHQLIFTFSPSGEQCRLSWGYYLHWDFLALFLPWIGLGIGYFSLRANEVKMIRN